MRLTQCITLHGTIFLSSLTLHGQGQQPPPQVATENKPEARPATPKFVDPNPALLYWQALSMLPDFRPAQVKVVNDVLEGVLPASDDSVTALLATSRKALERFARAAKGDQPCVWGTTFDEGPFAPMPHLTKVQLLCRLALVQVEAHYARGDQEEAIRWTSHVHRAARHIAAEPLIITVIMQHSVEQQALRLSARRAPVLDAFGREDLVKVLQKLPPLHTVRDALTGEHAMADWIRHMVIGIQNNPENEQMVLEMARKFLEAQKQASAGAHSGQAGDALASIEQWKQQAEQARVYQAKAEAASVKPWKAFQADMQEIRGSLSGAGAVLKTSLPGLEGAMRKEFESKTLRAMLIAVLETKDGLREGEMRGTKDAFEEKPFVVIKKGEQWSIATQEPVNGKPLALRIGE